MTQKKRASNRQLYPEALELETMITGVKNTGVTHHRAHCLDISRGGLGFSTEHALRKREIVKISLPAKGFDVTVSVLAEVLWVMPVNNRYRVGVRYVI